MNKKTHGDNPQAKQQEREIIADKLTSDLDMKDIKIIPKEIDCTKCISDILKEHFKSIT